MASSLVRRARECGLLQVAAASSSLAQAGRRKWGHGANPHRMGPRADVRSRPARLRPPAARLPARTSIAVPPRRSQWFVMEGVREQTADGAFLGIEGADGRTTLSVANLAAREDLIAKIGTPDYRGSRMLAYDGDEFQAWETMAVLCARYRAAGLPLHRLRSARLAHADDQLLLGHRLADLLLGPRSVAAASLRRAPFARNGNAARHQRRRRHAHRSTASPRCSAAADATSSSAAPTGTASRSSTAARATTCFTGRPASTSSTAASRSSTTPPTGPTSSTTPAPAR